MGSSASSTFGSQASAIGDHHALAQTARELVRILPQALLGPRQPHQLQHLERAVERLLARGAAVQPDRLGHLLADLLGRVQRRLRVLEDHRHRVAAQLAQLRIGEADELAPLELDRAARRSRRRAGSRPRIERPSIDLPQPDSPTRPRVSPAVDRQIDVSHRLNGRARQLDVRAEVGRPPGRVRLPLADDIYRRLSRTSSASRRPSPTRLQAITTATRQNPTGYTSHHWPLEM